jgi:hypothetical protein
MSYFVVWDGAIQEAFDTLEEATARVVEHPGARVIGDKWLTLGKAKERVDQARRALDEVATMIDPLEVQRMRETLDELDAMFDEAWSRLGMQAASPLVPTGLRYRWMTTGVPRGRVRSVFMSEL